MDLSIPTASSASSVQEIAEQAPEARRGFSPRRARPNPGFDDRREMEDFRNNPRRNSNVYYSPRPTGRISALAVGGDATLSAEEAKRAWFAKQDAPTWGPATHSQTTWAEALPPPATLSQEEATNAWLATLNDNAFGSSAAPQTTWAAAPQPARSEDAAKNSWLAKLDAPTWGSAAASQTTGAAAPSEPARFSEEEAKSAWLAKVDAPSWGKAATALAGVASEAAKMAELEAHCDAGDHVACDELSREEEAKRAWLASLDVPTWGKSAAEVAQLTSECNAGYEAACDELSREEEAKRAWLAKLDAPAWGAA